MIFGVARYCIFGQISVSARKHQKKIEKMTYTAKTVQKSQPYLPVDGLNLGTRRSLFAVHILSIKLNWKFVPRTTRNFQVLLYPCERTKKISHMQSWQINAGESPVRSAFHVSTGKTQAKKHSSGFFKKSVSFSD